MTWRAGRYAVAVLAVTLALVVRAQDPIGTDTLADYCGAPPTVEEDRPAYDTCVLVYTALLLEASAPPPAFMEALPLVTVFAVGGLGFRIGLGF